MPGGRRCSVAICKSFSTKAKSLGQSLTFHSFPKDKKLRKLWIQKCYRKDKMNPETAFICSLHFVRDDYEDAVKADIMNIAPKKLTPTAVPSQLLLPSKDMSLPKVRPTKFTKEKERKSFVEAVIDKSVSDSKEPQETGEMETNISLTEIPAACSVTPTMVMEEKILDLQTQNENLRKQNETLLNNMKKCEHENYLMAQALHRAHLLVETIEPASEDVEVSDRESTSSSSDTTKSTDIENRSEQDGLMYLAGYLAHKHKNEFPYLGTATNQLPLNVHDYGIPTSWVQSLSYGGLIQPSEKWASEVKRLEHYFVKYHKQTFKDQQEVVKKTIEYITSKVASLQIDNKLIESFCKLRIILRMKYLNAQRAQQKLLKRYSNFPDRKYEKKMKKIVK